MLIIHMARSFSLGDTLPVRINTEDTTLTWRDPETLVIGNDDAREILAHYPSGDDLMAFICEDTPKDVVLDGGQF